MASLLKFYSCQISFYFNDDRYHISFVFYNLRFMISCDQCGGWFHGECVEITEEAGKSMEENNESFVCPKCQQPGMHIKSLLIYDHKLVIHTSNVIAS